MEPTYINIFMHFFQKTFLCAFTLQPITHCRYIDDIFQVRLHGIDTIETFLEKAYRTHPNMLHTRVL